MSELQRNALARDLALRLIGASLDDLRIVDALVSLLYQLRALSWTRRRATTDTDVDNTWHLVGLAGGSFVTRCAGRWPAGDAVTTLDGPPLHELCVACVERWARGKDIALYGLVELARDLANEDRFRAELHDLARAEMNGGGK